jgi:dGTPase
MALRWPSEPRPVPLWTPGANVHAPREMDGRTVWCSIPARGVECAERNVVRGAYVYRNGDGTGSRADNFPYFATEREAFAEVVAGCALAGRHPAVWLMEAADDLTYTLADIEDAVEMNIIPLAEYERLVQPLALVESERLAREENASQRIALLRARAIGRLLDACAEAFVAHRAALLAGRAPERGGLIGLIGDAGVTEPFAAIRRTNVERVYFHARKVEHEIGARDTLAKALSVFVPACAAFARGTVSLREKQALSLMDDYAPAAWMRPGEVIRCAVDFVAGMTDHYAAYLAQRLRGL